jgi:molybdate transport system permease protein
LLHSLFLSIGVVFFALFLLVPFGLWLGLVQARRVYSGKILVDVLILLPLILPPSVVGYFLLLLLGRSGPLGVWLEALFGVRLVFSFWGAVIAAAVVAFPMVAKGAEAAFSKVDKELEDAAQVDGLSPRGVFFRVTLPLAKRGVSAAIFLGAGRAMGEFGATLMFAGNLPGKTDTLPLAIYSAFMINDEKTALSLAALLTALSVLLALVLAKLSRD